MNALQNTRAIIGHILKFNGRDGWKRLMSVKLQEDPFSPAVQRTDEEWLNAKPYGDIPGPGKWTCRISFLPGGKYHGCGLEDVYKSMREQYGPIFKIHGIFDKDLIFTHNVEDFKTVFRNEGLCPERFSFQTFDYYRKHLRPDAFHGLGGLFSDQGKSWADVRNKANPILLKTQTVKHHLPVIDTIAKEFLIRISKIRDSESLEMPTNFGEEIQKWAFESICAIALDKRLNLLLSDNPAPEVQKLTRATNTFFQLGYEFELYPAFWKYYETEKFKKLISAFDDITEITTNYIIEAKERFKTKGEMENATSILEQLLIVDQNVAIVIGNDMLMAGIDTTSAAFTNHLYHLAKYPQKQERLRKEIMKILPETDSPLTVENTKNMPYLRAFIKESLRMKPITLGTFRVIVRDLVLSGYRVPKNTAVIMGGMTNDEKYFPKSREFFPERWLKQGEDACPAARMNHPLAYLPFGFGPRACIGKRIADMEIETMISRVVRNYHISWHHPDMKYVSNLLTSPVGNMQFKFTDL